LNKISLLFLGSGIFVGLIITNRKSFLTRGPYGAGAIAALLFLPYVIWNITHDFAHLEFIKNASAGKYSGLNAFSFIKDQLLFLNPISTPLWISGLLALFLFEPLKKYRIIAFIYVTALAILLVNKTSKGEYLAPAYASLFAAAAVFVEQKLTRNYLYWIRFAYPALLITTSVFLMPMVLPVLSVDRYISYSKTIGIEPSSSEGKELSDLPQFYADMFGWREKAQDVAAVYNSLSEAEKTDCAIVSSNYGRCGAIDFFGKRYGLPKSIGTHNNYWLWGTREYSGAIVVILGGTLEDHVDDFESVMLAGVSTCTHCMPYENNVNIFLCRGLKYNLKDVWIHEKHYD
jgi:hypothetical protein